MQNVRGILLGIVTGIKDSICGIISIHELNKIKEKKQCVQPKTTMLAIRRKQESNRVPVKIEETSIVRRIIQCCVLNGCIFWVSILAFSHFLLPALQIVMAFIFSNSPETASEVWSWLGPTLSFVFNALWVLPLFVLSRVVNSLWFQDIADTAYRHVRGRPQFLSGWSKYFADTLFSFLIQVLFLIQSYMVELLPLSVVGKAISLVHLCLLYSFYAFEYKWINMGWELHQRLAFMETNWPYFVGFGLPLAVLTSLHPSFVVSGIIFSIFFPLFIISGNTAIPLTGTCEYKLKLFALVVYLSNAAFQQTIKLDRSDKRVHQTRNLSE